jgi:hypothetical protein
VCIYPNIDTGDVAAVSDEDLALLLTVVWVWHDPIPVAQAA